MKQIYEDLWQSELYSSGILNTHAYLLTRPAGNILFYNTGFKEDLSSIEALGGITHQLLTHRDEVGASLGRIKNQFGSLLGIGKLEASFAKEHAEVDITFDTDDSQLEDVSVLFTPGHSEGSICYFYKSPYGKKYLFSGDSFFKWNGRWATFVIDGFGGTSLDMAESLEKIRPLSPDVVLSSGFVGDVAYGELSPEEWASEVDRLIASNKKAASRT